ncbi:MAG: hypothetical protein OSJ59_09555 [Lachnospiraceae bacterium]|nr:hypothetical protein [Lachnospiraceae bacterium]
MVSAFRTNRLAAYTAALFLMDSSDTGEVVRSGRKAWSDVGTKAYRDLTGE